MKTKKIGGRKKTVAAKREKAKGKPVAAAKPVASARKSLSRYQGNSHTLGKKLKMLPKLASAKDKAGKPLSISAIVTRMISTLTENEKNILRERCAALKASRA